jgi:hypothetical protein
MCLHADLLTIMGSEAISCLQYYVLRPSTAAGCGYAYLEMRSRASLGAGEKHNACAALVPHPHLRPRILTRSLCSSHNFCIRMSNLLRSI